MPMQIETLFIDLDGTLYPAGNGVWDLIADRMNHYIHEHFGVPLEDVPALRLAYYHQYGTSLRGLQQHYDVDAEAYLAYVHDIPVQDYVRPNPALRQMLLKLPQPKWILTNSDRNHSNRILQALGINDLFEGVVDVIATDYYPKPDPYVFEVAINLAGNPDPNKSLFIDDLPKNLRPAREMGFTTVLVGDKPPEDTHDYFVRDIVSLVDELPWLTR